MPRRPEDFPATTIRTIASRVNNVCSNPHCRVVTIGPHRAGNRTNNVGEAAHINGARPGSARHNPELALCDLKSAYNAIWLCRTCAGKVDNDEQSFPEALLRSWKQQAEDEATKELGMPRPTPHPRLETPQFHLAVSFDNGCAEIAQAASWADEPMIENKMVERIPPRRGGIGAVVIYPPWMWYVRPQRYRGTASIEFFVENLTPESKQRNVEVVVTSARWLSGTSSLVASEGRQG